MHHHTLSRRVAHDPIGKKKEGKGEGKTAGSEEIAFSVPS